MSGAEAAWGFFAVLAVLASLAPAFIGMALADSARIPSFAGFLIGLVGSWPGVIGLYLYGHWQKRSPAVEPTPASAADRLRALQDLRDEGLITEEEYRARREAALDKL